MNCEICEDTGCIACRAERMHRLRMDIDHSCIVCGAKIGRRLIYCTQCRSKIVKEADYYLAEIAHIPRYTDEGAQVFSAFIQGAISGYRHAREG